MAKGPESKITFKVFNQEFNKAMDEMKNESSKLRQEFTLQQEQLKLSGTATEHLNTKLGYLQQQQQLAAQKVAATEQQLSKAKAMYGENSTEVEKLSRQLGNAQIAEQKFSNQMKETETALQRLAQQNSSTAQALTTLGAEETKLVNQSTKLRAEYDLQRASLGNHATESEKLGAKLQYLSQVQQNASQQTRNCAQQLAAAKSQYGENSSEVNKLETKLLQLSTAEQQLKNQIETTNRSLKEQEIETKRVADATRQLDTFFEATGTSVDQFANALGGHLTSAIKQGTASSSQLDEALKRIGHEALGAETDIEKLQRVLRSVDAGNSIQQVRNELRDLQQEAGRTEKKFEGLKVGLENVIGGLAAGGGIATAIEKSMDMSKLKTKIDVSFEVPESSKRSVEDAVRSVTTYGVDVEEALEGTRRQWALNKDASDEANAAIVKGAATIASTYAGIDFNELIQEANEIGATLGITNEEALGLVNTLLKTGFPPEQLDIIAEYGDQMIQAGFSAKEVQGILSAGIDTKSWNIDNLLDGVKEGRIKMAEFGAGVDKSMKEVLDKTKISADQFEKWGQAIAGGGENGQKAMLEATKALAGVENATDRNVLGTKMFGTMWEDQGKKIIDTILKAEGKQVDLKKGVDDLHNTNSKLDASPTVKMQKAINDLQKALEPVLLVIADLISKFAEWVSDNPKLAATLVAIGVAIGVISGAILAITPLIPIITSIISVIMSVAGAIAATVGVATALIPIIIAAVVALGIIIYKNWDDIQKWTIEAWNAITDFLKGIWDGISKWANETWESMSESTVSVWNAITDFLEELWNGIMASLSETWNSIVETTTETWNSIVEYLTGIWNGVVETLSEIWSRISQTTSEVWTAIREFFISTWNGLVEFLTPILQGIADFFSMIWNGIYTVIQTVWNFIMQYLQAIWTAILYFATPIFESIKNFISECWNTICSTTSFVWETIKNFLVSCWNGLVAFVMPIFEQIKSWIIAVWDTISSATITVWDTMKNFLQSCWNGLVAIVTPIFDAIKNWIVNTWNMISSTTSAVWNTIKNSLSSLWNTIVSTASSVFNTIKEAISSVWNTISSTSSTIWNGIKSTLSNIWNSITSTASSVWNGLKSAIMTPVNWVVDAVSGAFNGMKSAVLGVWDGIKSGTKTAINGVIRLINKFIDGFNTPAELLNGIPGVSAPTIPHVPMLAKGGHVLGDGQFIAGEAGPELFSKKGNKVSVTPLSSSERMGGIGGQLGLLTKSVTDMIQHAASQLAQIVAYDVPHALGEALLTSVPHIVGANAGDGILNQQPIEVNFYNTVRNDRDIDRMFEKADDWFAQKGRNLNIGIGRN